MKTDELNYVFCKQVRERISLDTYLYLTNEIIKLNSEIKNLNEYINSLDTTINVLKSDNIKFKTFELLNELDTTIQYKKIKLDTYRRLYFDLTQIIPANLREYVYIISLKLNLSLAELSERIGLDTEVLNNLVHEFYIKESELKKFLDYFDIKGTLYRWKSYIKE